MKNNEMIQLDDIKRDYPKSWARIKEHLSNGLQEESEETLKDEDLDILAELSVINSHRGVLYDVFDKEEIYISIYTIANNKAFYGDVLDKEGTHAEATSRAELEKQLFISAFKLLEEKL